MCFNERLIKTFCMERGNNIRSGVYGLTQREFAYNSNKIEGSRLTKEHTSSLFDTGSVYIVDGEYRAKDVEEATGHFVMFNGMLDTLSQSLSQDLIKYFHKCQKQGVFEDIANGYAIGDYKKRVNYVGDIETSHPSKVVEDMTSLLYSYSSTIKSLENLAVFHVRYEEIHPFQDGNGRTGRMILFRECLINNITPFIIRDVNKSRYLACLSNAEKTGDYSSLVSYFKSEQDWYYNKVKDALL